MIYRLRYCNKDGVEARVDIQKGLASPVIDVEGTERPFILSYNNDNGDKSGMFLSSSADIEIYETPEFNIDNLKTSNETELAVTHYINNVISWQGFIIPDFFSIEVRNNPVITMTASDRIGTLKSVTLSNLPSMISLRELAILCLNKTGLSLPLRTMADFNNGTGVNDFFNSKILTQRLSDTKGRSISCYDILSSILTASGSFLVQRSGAWHIINKIQHEAGSGKLYTDATSFTNWSDVIFNFSDISTGGRRTIVPVASSVGVFHEFGGGRLHPENYDFSQGLTGWTAMNGFNAVVENRSIEGYTLASNPVRMVPNYGEVTTKNTIRSINPTPGFDPDYDNVPYLKSPDIPIVSVNDDVVDINVDISAIGPHNAALRYVVLATNGATRLYLNASGAFEPFVATNERHISFLSFGQPGINIASVKSRSITGKLDNPAGYSISVRVYGSGEGNPVFINFVSVSFSNADNIPKGTMYKREQGANYTKTHEIPTVLWGDYLTNGLNGYFYDYPIDDTSSLYNSNNELTSKWTAYNDTEQLPLLQHVTRQKSRLFSVAHDLLSAEIEASNFDPLAIFVSCNKRYTVVSAQFDFFKSNLSVELEEVAFQSATVRDFIYSYFGDGESGIKSIGGISSGTGGGSTGGGLTPEQLEILNNLSSWWKYDEVNDAIYSELSVYSKKEVSAYGLGESGGGSSYNRLDAWADYDSTKSGWVLSALLGNELNTRVGNLDTRVGNLEGGSALTVNTTGTGNAITSLTKSGTVITANKDLTFSLSGHTHTISDISGLQTALNSKLETSIFNTHNNDNVRHITGAERTKWDKVVTDFSNLEIGGRNYFSSKTNTEFDENNEYVLPTYQSRGSYRAFYNITVPMSTFVGENLMLSFECLSPNGSTPISIYNNNGNSRYRISGIRGLISPISDEWVRQDIKFTVVDLGESYNDASSNKIEIYASQQTGVKIRNVKLSKGTIPTDWTPAPEDQISDWLTTDVNSFSFIKNKPTLLSQFTDNIGVATHIANKSNPHNVTKAQVGLGNVDNTSDLNKPISTATQTALNLKLDKSIFDDLFEKVEVSTGVFAIKAKYDFYSIGEVSAYGLGSGGSGGGSYDRLDAWADYDSSKAGWVLSALLGNELNTRVGNLEGGSALTVNTTGTGNAITSITKAGTVITANKDLTFSLSNHLHTGVYEPVFTKNSAFNKNFGTTAGTVAQGNDSRIINGQTAYGWGNHASAGYALNSAFSTHNNDNVRHITGAERTKWDGVVADFSNLEIGGRNLALNTATNIVAIGIGQVNQILYNGYNALDFVEQGIKTDDFVTITYYWKVRSLDSNDIYGNIHLRPRSLLLDNSISFGYYNTPLQYFSNDVTSGYTSETFQVGNVRQITDFWFRLNAPTNVEITIYKVKLEKGNKATDWTPALEDLISDWNTTDVNSFSFIKNKPTLLSQFTDNIGVATHIANTSNPHSVTKSQVGLGNVDNTADSAKNVLSATKLTNARTIAGVSFDGTANISIPFANLSSKPTTLAGYGITDAVTLNTTQTITGAKTFSTLLTASAGVNTPKVDFGNGFTVEPSGTELVFKYNGVVKQRMLSDGSIVATEEITAFG